MPGLFDRIKDTWIAASPTLLTTLSTFAVTGTAPGGYQTFSQRYVFTPTPDANIPVAIVSQTSTDWMTCWCTYTSSNTLRIDTIMFSSNGDAGVTFPAGTMDIFVTPAARAIPGLREANTFTANNYFNGGNVGIGTASPASKLVVSAVQYNTNQDAAYLVAGTTSYTGATTNWGTYGFAHKLKSTAGGVARVALDAITGSGLTEIFCADTSGNFGIGTPTPNKKLTVSASGADARINIIDSDTTASTAVSVIEFSGSDARGGYVGIVNGALALLSEAALANGIQISANGAERMRITNTGNVGIGTASPSSPLHVVSAANSQPQIIADHVAGAGTGAAYFILDRARGTPSAKTAVVSGDTLGTLMARGHDGSGLQNSAWIELNVDGAVSAGNVPGSIAFLTTPVGGTAASRMRISANGNVGIGTTSPSALLTIDDNGAVGTGLVLTGGGSGGNLASFIRDVGANAAVKINASGGDPQIAFEGPSNTFTIGTDGNDFKISDDPVLGNNDRLTINLSGNVGVGVSLPTFRLVAGNSSTDAGWMYSSGSISYLGLGGFSGAADGAFQLSYDRSNGNITLNGGARDTPVPRVRIDNSGNVGIGTTGPGQLLHIERNQAAETSLFVTNTNSSGYVAVRLGPADRATNLDALVYASTIMGLRSGNRPMTFETGNPNVEQMRLNTLGNVGIGTSSPTNFGAGYKTLELTGTTGGGVFRSASSTVLTDMYSEAALGIGVIRTVGAYGLRIATNSTERIFVSSTGSVGVNQSSPLARLHVTDADGANSLLVSGATRGLRVFNTSTGPVLEGVDHTGTGSYQPLAVGGSDVRFTTSNNERMRIFPSGAVAFHSTFDPNSLTVNIGAGLLRIYRQNTSGEGGQLELMRSGDNSTGWYIDVLGTATTDPNELRFVDAHNSAVRLSLSARGVAGIVNDQGPASGDTLALGFRGSPNNDLTGNYTLALTDAGRTIRKTDNTARTVTVPADATVNFPIGTCIMLCNTEPSAGLLTISPAAGVSLIRYTTSKQASGTRTVNFGGSATLRKVAANYWSITGTGVG